MTKQITAAQQRVLDFIVAFQQENGFPPTHREIAAGLGFRSTRAAAEHVRALAKKGLLRLHAGKSRGLELTALAGPAGRLPVVGRIAAGTPILAVESFEDSLQVDPAFFSGGQCFAVKVTGESMVGAHIADGDYVVLRRQDTAGQGQIAAVLIGEEVTLKYVHRGQRGLLLKAANPQVPDIEVKDPAAAPRILGVMVGLIRRGT